MCQLSNEDWMINLYSTATDVERKYGSEVVSFVFGKYGSKSPEDLSPSYYSDVFGELYQMAVD